MKHLIPALVVLWTHLAVSAQEPPPREILQEEVRELRTVVKTLRERNRVLERRNERLMEDIRVLGRQVRTLRESEETEAETAAESADAEQQGAVPAAERPPRVMYVNRTWHYLLIDVGTTAGLAAGDIGRVVRDGTVIGTVEITDAKTSQSVADLRIDSLDESGVYPRKRDEVRFK